MPLLGQYDPRYYVRYPDGQRSERVDKHTAINYQSIFGGVVVCAERKKGWKGWITEHVLDRGIRYDA
jgi:hypothetical protein